MDITSLTVVLSAVAVVAAAVLVVSNEPPLWVHLLGCAGSLPLSGVLLRGPAVTSVLGEGSAAVWGLRLAVASTVTAVLSFFFGGDGRAARTTSTPARSGLGDGPSATTGEGGDGEREDAGRTEPGERVADPVVDRGDAVDGHVGHHGLVAGREAVGGGQDMALVVVGGR